MGFEELGVSRKIVKGLNELNIKQPTSIQEEVIPLLLNNDTDLIAQAQTGTGKTAAFGVPIVQKVSAEKDYIQAVILSPTRELSQQIKQQLFKYTKFTGKKFAEAVYGGAQIDPQIQALKRPTQMLVATPGRLADLIRRKAVDIRKASVLVLDEADEMLSMGFKKDIEFIFNSMPQEKNVWLFSATLPMDIQYIIKNYLSQDAKHIKTASNEIINDKINHQYVLCEGIDKFNVLEYFLKTQKNQRGVIFCNTKASARSLYDQMLARKISCGILEGDMHQKERDKMLRAFKGEKLKLLIASDVAARGIDVAGLAFVVHYEIPKSIEYYIHRSGRTARGGYEGISMAFAIKNEMSQLRKIENELKLKMKSVPFG